MFRSFWRISLVFLALATLLFSTEVLSEPSLIAGMQRSTGCSVSEAQEILLRQSVGVEGQKLKLIVIDPGHGGENEGAIGLGKRHEKHLTLELALALKKNLKKKMPEVAVVLTRESDVNLALSDRIEFANALGADLFISLHFNSSLNPEAFGFESFWAGDFHEMESEKEALSEEARNKKRIAAPRAQVMANSFNENMAKRFTKSLDRGVKPGDYTVLTKAQIPAVVLELAFLSHKQEARQVLRKRVQKKYIEVLTQAIKDYEQKLASSLDLYEENCKI